MNDQQFDPTPLIILLCILVGSMVGFCIGCSYMNGKCNNEFIKKAIENNAAHYDMKTGKFTWNNEKPK